MRVLTRVLLAGMCLLILPATVRAQGTISGVVRDTSGGVLPGVTVEAASPALIEKVRSVSTDGAGQYSIVDLRPGVYTVTFTLPGFSTVKREGIELSGNFTATVNADLRVGALEETITVSGAAPVVDVQTVAEQKVMSKEIIDNIPTSRSNFSIATMIAGVNTDNVADVGGKNSIGLVRLTAHGSRTGDQRITIDGLAIDSAECNGDCSGYLVNMGGVQELAVDYASGPADFENGGVRVNAIPKEGGNIFSGSMFVGGMKGGPPDNSSNGWMQANNLTQDLIDRGLVVPTDIRKVWDINPGMGGPIKKDKLWFYAAYMNRGEHAYNGAWANKNAGDPTKWHYEPATNVQKIETFRQQTSKQLRLTWQANEKNKMAFFYDFQERCSCPNTVTPQRMPESQTAWHYRYNDYAQISWSSPVTNRLLLEAGIGRHPEHLVSPAAEPADVFDPYPSNGGLGALPGLIPVLEQSTGLIYRGFYGVGDGMFDGRGATLRERFAVSYITGSHAFKFGLQGNHKWRNRKKLAFAGPVGQERNMDFRFNNGVPNQITQYATPYDNRSIIPVDLGVYAQDRWVIGKLTANIGVRFDHLETSFPDNHLGPTYFWPDRDITFPAQDWVSWNDITPRFAAAYDVFGDGKTAIKASANKYTLGVGLQGFFADGSNPITLRGVSTSRSWNDRFYPVGDPRRENFEPDCDLRSPSANAECGAMAQNIFVPLVTSRIDPAILTGWQNRPNNWTFSTELEQQLGPNMGMSVGYFRRVYGGFVAKDNLATTASDYTEWSYTAPVDSRLPGGGGYVVPGNFDLNPNKVGAIDGYYTFAEAYGKVIEHWDGVDFGMQVNLPGALMVRGGLSSGRTLTDDCAVRAKSPEIVSSTSPAGATTAIATQIQNTYCHQSTGLETQYKALGTYTVPRVDVGISVNYQNLPGPSLAANVTVPTATAALTLGRPLSNTASNATVNILDFNQVRQERVNQLDLKFSKRLSYGRSRATVSMDLFNALNVNTVLTENQSYAVWRTPLSILQARFVKFGVQFDF
jgi:hypothetical protein